MPKFIYFLFFSITLSASTLKSSDDSLFNQNAVIFPLSNLIDNESETNIYKLGFLLSLNERIGLRFFLGFNLNKIITLKPANAEFDLIVSKESYYFNSGLKVNLLKSDKIFIYCNLDLSLIYRGKGIEGVDFTSLFKTEHNVEFQFWSIVGFEYFILRNLSLSIESGLFYNLILGKKSARIGNIIQEDKLPTEISFGLRPFSNILNISVYF